MGCSQSRPMSQHFDTCLCIKISDGFVRGDPDALPEFGDLASTSQLRARMSRPAGGKPVDGSYSRRRWPALNQTIQITY